MYNEPNYRDTESATPRERYKQEIDGIKAERLRSLGADPDTMREIDQDAEEMSDAVDRGEYDDLDKVEPEAPPANAMKAKAPQAVSKKQFEMTKEQFDKIEQHKLIQQSTGILKKLEAKYLSSEEQVLMKDLFEKFQKDELTDPVLLHLFQEKLNVCVRAVSLQLRDKDLELKMLNEIQSISNEVLKSQGALESIDKQILAVSKSKHS